MCFMSRKRPSTSILMVGGTGLVAVLAASIIRIGMGGGTGHRFIPVDIAQLFGSLLILIASALALRERRRGSDL